MRTCRAGNGAGSFRAVTIARLDQRLRTATPTPQRLTSPSSSAGVSPILTRAFPSPGAPTIPDHRPGRPRAAAPA